MKILENKFERVSDNLWRLIPSEYHVSPIFPVGGDASVRWVPGLRLTEVRPRSLWSDGSARPFPDDEFDWVEVVPSGFSEIGSVDRAFFKRPAEIFAFGHQRGAGHKISPYGFCAPTDSFYPTNIASNDRWSFFSTRRLSGNTVFVPINDSWCEDNMIPSDVASSIKFTTSDILVVSKFAERGVLLSADYDSDAKEVSFNVSALSYYEARTLGMIVDPLTGVTEEYDSCNNNGLSVLVNYPHEASSFGFHKISSFSVSKGCICIHNCEISEKASSYIGFSIEKPCLFEVDSLSSFVCSSWINRESLKGINTRMPEKIFLNRNHFIDSSKIKISSDVLFDPNNSSVAIDATLISPENLVSDYFECKCTYFLNGVTTEVGSTFLAKDITKIVTPRSAGRKYKTDNADRKIFVCWDGQCWVFVDGYHIDDLEKAGSNNTKEIKALISEMREQYRSKETCSKLIISQNVLRNDR